MDAGPERKLLLAALALMGLSRCEVTRAGAAESEAAAGSERRLLLAALLLMG